MRRIFLVFLVLVLFLIGCSTKGENVIGNAYQSLSSPEKMEFQECWQDKCARLMKVDQPTCAQNCYNQAKSN